MAFDWLAAAKWLGPKAYELAKKISLEKDATDLQQGRNEHAVAAANEIARMILLGATTESANLTNLVRENEALVEKGAKLPRDLRSMVDTLIEKAREAEFAEYRWDHHPGGGN